MQYTCCAAAASLSILCSAKNAITARVINGGGDGKHARVRSREKSRSRASHRTESMCVKCGHIVNRTDHWHGLFFFCWCVSVYNSFNAPTKIVCAPVLRCRA